MVRETLNGALASLNTASGLAVLLVGIGIWLGVLSTRVFYLGLHPSEAAHKEQLQKTIKTEILLTSLDKRISDLQMQIGRQKVEIITEIATRFADDRFRKSQFLDWVRKTERQNPNWTASDLQVPSNP